MPRRLLSLSNARDFLLVLTTVIIVVVLGVLSVRFALDGATVDPASVSAAARPGHAGGAQTRDSIKPAMSLGLVETGATVTLTGPSRPAPAVAPEQLAPVERFSGESGGRKETIIIRDPGNPRTFLLETASLMHRRGWIGVENRVDRE